MSSVIRAVGGVVLIAATVLIAACASEQPITVSFPVGANPKTTAPSVIYPYGVHGPQPSAPAPGAATRTTTVTVPEVHYRLPAADATSSAKPAVRGTALVGENNVRLVVKPEEDDYRGGAVVYNWIPNQVYELFVAPLELTDITLEPGESVVSPPAAGDTSDFIVAQSHSIENGREVQHILLKAVYADKRTTLSIDTDRRTYTFAVTSYPSVYMPLVSFTYPLEEAKAAAQRSSAPAKSLPIYGRITDLDFGYTIVPHSATLPHWMPSTVFSDGRRTYIEFASAARASYAPVLFAVDGKGKRTLVNYRVVGDYYVVDEVLRHAELVLDVNDGNIITILKTR
jgi:type IV secretion system protein TrbG